jgi:predicted porin
MRKLLLASAAMLGAASGIASAQMAPSQGQLVSPANPVTPSSSFDASNAYGQPSTYHGAMKYNPLALPTPGTIVIHLGGKVQFDAAEIWTTGNVQHSGNGGIAGAAKLNPTTFGAYFRLYPGVDGMATNGLRYGASVEIRENFPGGAAQQTPALAPAPSGSTYTSGQTLYVRRAFTYVAADNIGLLRMGTTDGVLGLFDNCIFTNQCWDAGIGIFNGGMMQSQDIAGLNPPWVWLSQAGAEYGNVKITYLSPQFFGFDFGVQYAPSMGNGYTACASVVPVGGTGGPATNNNNQASSFCNQTTTGIDPTRWYNQVGVGVRYQGSFGPVDVGAFAFYETAYKESFFGPAVHAGLIAAPAGTPVTTPGIATAGTRYDNLSFFSAAGYVKANLPIGSLTFAADYIGGALNGQLTMRPQGGAPEHALVTGVTYNNGPLTLGVSTAFIESQGAAQLTHVSQRHEWELAFGGNYNIAPGLYLTAEYMYMYRHQGGFDFNTGLITVSHTGAATFTRDIHGQGIQISTVVNW